MSRLWILLAITCCWLSARVDAADQVELKRVTWKVEGVEREALVSIPPGHNKPVIFAWHGHGGTSNYAARKFSFHTQWPEAVVIYPQGLPTPTPLIDPDGKRSGWQKYIGDQNDRDLEFFDAMMKSCLADYQVDPANVFSAGHSNGGYFTYVLDAARGNQLTAIAPVAATANLRDLRELKAKPVLHVAGEKDPLVKFALQEKTIDFMKRLNGCDANGQPWGQNCTEFRSGGGTPVVTLVHSGGHEIPAGVAEQIVLFFKQQLKKSLAP